MLQYSILIGCDQAYYNDWGITLLKSIIYHNPWIKLRCHVVNPDNLEELDTVEYTTEYLEFVSDEVRISYLQAVRFIAASKIPMNENFITLDTDTICARSFTEEDFGTLFEKQHVMQHHKQARWLACLVTFGQDNFRIRYAELLNQIPLDQWQWGRDQLIMPQLDKEYNFSPVGTKWIISGKIKNDSVFLTLKGDQKITNKYLTGYNNYKVTDEKSL
jgi:hypothetical protein